MLPWMHHPHVYHAKCQMCSKDFSMQRERPTLLYVCHNLKLGFQHPSSAYSFTSSMSFSGEGSLRFHPCVPANPFCMQVMWEVSAAAAALEARLPTHVQLFHNGVIMCGKLLESQLPGVRLYLFQQQLIF